MVKKILVALALGVSLIVSQVQAAKSSADVKLVDELRTQLKFVGGGLKASLLGLSEKSCVMPKALSPDEMTEADLLLANLFFQELSVLRSKLQAVQKTLCGESDANMMLAAEGLEIIAVVKLTLQEFEEAKLSQICSSLIMASLLGNFDIDPNSVDASERLSKAIDDTIKSEDLDVKTLRASFDNYMKAF